MQSVKDRLMRAGKVCANTKGGNVDTGSTVAEFAYDEYDFFAFRIDAKDAVDP